MYGNIETKDVDLIRVESETDDNSKFFFESCWSVLKGVEVCIRKFQRTKKMRVVET